MQLADVTSGGFIGISVVMYVVLVVTLGVLSIGSGHWITVHCRTSHPALLVDRRASAKTALNDPS
jgi:hypothetical protein